MDLDQNPGRGGTKAAVFAIHSKQGFGLENLAKFQGIARVGVKDLCFRKSRLDGTIVLGRRTIFKIKNSTNIFHKVFKNLGL